MFLRNAWYVAAWSTEIGRKPTAVTILNEMVVLYRTENGRVVALEDRCPHRNLPLSCGALVGSDRIQCGYHGMEFDPAGTCIYEPESKKSVKWATVRAYPVEERHGWVFVWTGDPARADISKVPVFQEKGQRPDWYDVYGHEIAKCGYRMISDNLFTLSHLAYVHPQTVGGVDFAEQKFEYTFSSIDDPIMGPGVRLKHLVHNVPVPEVYTNFSGMVDRWTLIDFHAPCYTYIRFGTCPGGSVNMDNMADAMSSDKDVWEVYHAATPETEISCHDFWSNVVPAGLYDKTPVEKEAFEKVIRQAIHEDMIIYEAMQKCILMDKTAPSTDVNPKGALREDQGLLNIRKLLARLIATEQTESSSQKQTRGAGVRRLAGGA